METLIRFSNQLEAITWVSGGPIQACVYGSGRFGVSGIPRLAIVQRELGEESGDDLFSTGGGGEKERGLSKACVCVRGHFSPPSRRPFHRTRLLNTLKIVLAAEAGLGDPSFAPLSPARSQRRHGREGGIKFQASEQRAAVCVWEQPGGGRRGRGGGEGQLADASRGALGGGRTERGAPKARRTAAPPGAHLRPSVPRGGERAWALLSREWQARGSHEWGAPAAATGSPDTCTPGCASRAPGSGAAAHRSELIGAAAASLRLRGHGGPMERDPSRARRRSAPSTAQSCPRAPAGTA